jgi:hypothetical protein
MFTFVNVQRPWMRESIIVVLMVVLLAVAFGIDFRPEPNVVVENVALTLLFVLMGVWVYIHQATLAEWAKANEMEGTGSNDGSHHG